MKMRLVVGGLILGAALGALAGYGVASMRQASSTVKSTSSSQTSVSTTTTTSSTTQPVFDNAALARRFDRIVQFATLGRADAINHDFAAAVQNREDTLTRLGGLPHVGASSELIHAIGVFDSAMKWSLKSDEDYASGKTTSDANAHTTMLKEEFVALFNPIARRYGLPTFDVGQI